MDSRTLIVLMVGITAALAVDPMTYEVANVTCTPIENIFDVTPDVKREFFGKAPINPNTLLQLSLTLRNGTAKITLDDDIRNANSSLGINIDETSFSVYIKKLGKVTNLRKGSHTLKAGGTYNFEIHAVETGPNFNKYAFLAYLNKKFWFLIEEQPTVEILYSNYITINGVTIRSIKMCPDV